MKNRMGTVSLSFFCEPHYSKSVSTLLSTHAVCCRLWKDGRCTITPLFGSLLCTYVILLYDRGLKNRNGGVRVMI